MSRKSFTILGFVLILSSIPTISFSQEMSLPVTWEGKGVTTILSDYGTNDIEFDITLTIGEDGTVKGHTSTDDGKGTIKHLFYGEKNEHEIAQLNSQKVILVLMLNENSSDPVLVVMNGKILSNRFFYGEVGLTRYESGNATAKALKIDDQTVTEIDEDYLSADIKTALKKSIPFGAFKIEGRYKKG